MALKPISAKVWPLLLFVAGAGSVVAQGPQFNIQDLGTLPNMAACNGTALSQSGDVVGYCTAEAGKNLLLDAATTTTHVFLYSKGAMTDLNVTSPAVAFPTGVNNSDTVVGGAVNVNLASLSATAAPFIYQNGKLQAAPAQIQSALPLAINNAGQMVATSLQVSGGSLNFAAHSTAFVETLSSGAVSELNPPGPVGTSAAAFGINSGGTVAGGSVGEAAQFLAPVLWQNSSSSKTLAPLSGFQNGLATSVNDSGVASGVSFTIDFTKLTDNSATAHAVIFNNGAVTDIGVLSGDVSSAALSINNSGAVVGFSSNKGPDFTIQLDAYLAPPSTKHRAFLYSGGKMYDLSKQLVNGAGWQLSFATQINNAGQIVGTGLINGAQHAFLLTPILSPSTTGIVGAAFSTPAVNNISSNGVFTIFGSGLANAPQTLAAGDIVNNKLPTILGGTCVESGSTRWNLFYASPTQLNVLAGELPSSGTVPVKVVTNCGTANEVASAEATVSVAAVAPEFLYFLETASGQDPVAAVEATTGAYVGPPGLIEGATFTPAKAGDVLTAYGVGWGPTSSTDPIGTLASGIANLSSSNSLTLGGKTANILYIGLSPGSAGLYQVNFTVPEGLSAGNQPLVLTVDGVTTTSSAYIAVSN